LTAGIAASVALFWIGEGRQQQYGRCIERVVATTSRVHDPDPVSQWVADGARFGECGPDPGSSRPFVGVVAPIMILGGCALITNGRSHKLGHRAPK